MDLENKYGTYSIQNELLKLLKAFDSFCQEEDIIYSLDSGSLLGAVRHKGFIPWDDDLDIVVDRNNYWKMVNKINNNRSLSIERFTKSSMWVDRIRMNHNNFIERYYPTIDIFILDSVPENKLIAKIKVWLIVILQGMMKPRLNINKGNVIIKICSFITFCMGRLFSQETKYYWYNIVSGWGNNNKSKFSSCYNYPFDYIKRQFHSNVLSSIMRVPFESIEVSVMKDFDHYLTILYGDYMTPPKEKDRIPLHI